MPDATGTPTSPDGIPTYNTSGDPPSGKGFNTAMAAIQAALSARISKPSGIAAGEVPVWNGSGWARSSVTKIDAGSLTGITTANGSVVVSAANTDLSGPGNASSVFWAITTGGGSLRSIGASTSAGARIVLRNNAASTAITVKHLGVGGSGSQLYLRTLADLTLSPGDLIEFTYDGTTWVEANRDAGATGGMTLISRQALGAAGTITFSSIPQTYKSLKAVFYVSHSTYAQAFHTFRMNAIATEYNGGYMLNGGATTSFQDGLWGLLSYGYLTAWGEMLIQNYADTSKVTTWKSVFGAAHDPTAAYSTTASGYNDGLITGFQADTSAITSLTFSGNGGGGNLTSGSYVDLYGLS